MDPDESPVAGQRRDHDPGDPVREGLEHLQAAGRELVAAARAAIEACEEIVDDPETLRTAAESISDFFRAVAKSTGLSSEPRQRTDHPDSSTESNGGRTSGVEHIPLDPG